MSCLFQYSFIHYLKALEFIHNLNIAHRVSNPFYFLLSVRYSNSLLIFCRMHSMIILLFSGIQSHCAR